MAAAPAPYLYRMPSVATVRKVRTEDGMDLLVMSLTVIAALAVYIAG
jgi:hypothetical protein